MALSGHSGVKAKKLWFWSDELFYNLFQEFQNIFSPQIQDCNSRHTGQICSEVAIENYTFLYFWNFFAKLLRLTRAKNAKTWSKWRIIFLEINAKLKFLT